MAEYRANIFGADGHFISYRAFVCDNDSNATGWAKHLFGGEGKIALLCGERLVTQLGVKSAPRRDAVSREVVDGRMVPKK
jgi:hypothetical protein